MYAPVGGDDLEQAVRVGALQLRQHAIFQDIAYDGVLAYELFQDVGVGAPAGLGLLARWEHQLIEQHLAQLLGRVYIELVPGQLPDAALQGVYTRREALAEVGQGLPVHQETRALHLGQHLAERQLDIEIELLRPVFRQLRAHGGHELDVLNELGIFAAAMDIDGAGLPFLKAMNPNAGSKPVSDLKAVIDYAKMPFIVKGIMTVAGAEKAVEAGAAGIVVSNHGGRVLGQTRATADVLPDIAAAVGGKCVIFVDGGIRTGVDVFKALALGADAVLIGRPFVPAVYGGEAEGAKLLFAKLKAELVDTMTMCGAHTLDEITEEKVYIDK